jgi:hypothetical protein
MGEASEYILMLRGIEDCKPFVEESERQRSEVITVGWEKDRSDPRTSRRAVNSSWV